MLKLDTKGGIICSGILSIAFAITFLALMDDHFESGALYDLGKHVSSLQILGSLILLFGAFKENYKCFVPWMITTGLFIYLMFYMVIVLVATNGEMIFVPMMAVPFTVYLGCAFYSVQKAFNRMRKDSPVADTNLPDKKDYISII